MFEAPMNTPTFDNVKEQVKNRQQTNLNKMKEFSRITNVDVK